MHVQYICYDHSIVKYEFFNTMFYELLMTISCEEYNLTVKNNDTWNKTIKIIVRDKQVPTISRLISASLLIIITHANEQQK
jgi:hypothetical protein